MSPRIPMKNRVIRVSDTSWDAAKAAAERRGENLSEEIRKFIAQYGESDE